MTTFPRLLASAFLFCVLFSAHGAEPAKPAGPYHGVFREIPITDVTPQGWLAEFLQRQHDGLGLNYSVAGYPFNNSLWVGPAVNDWGRYEEDAYLLDGVYRCGLLLRDHALTGLGLENIDYVLNHPRADGRLGPELDIKNEIGTPAWPFVIFTRMLMAYYGATGDPAVLDALTKHYLTLPAGFGANDRDVNNVEGMCWVYGQTGDPRLIALAEQTWANFTKNKHNQWQLEKLQASSKMRGHGVSVCEATKQPALLYLYTGKKEYLDAALGGFLSLQRDHELVDGVISSDEGLHGKAPEGVHETCDIVDYTWSLGYLLQASGDGMWGDKVERAVFNAGFGALDKQFKAHQYFSSPNQMVSTQHCSAPPFGPANEDRQAYRPGFAVQCCTGNVHRLIPNYAARLWLTAGDGGLAAALYGPNTVKTEVGAEGVPVVIEEKTDYPFDGTVDLKITADQPVKFPLSVRIPGWADNATVSVNGQPVPDKAVPGTFLKIDRTFASGDVVRLDFPMSVRLEKPVPNGLAVLRGPLLFSLKVAENRTERHGLPQTGKDYPTWDLQPASPWNYVLDLKGPQDLDKIRVQAAPVSGFPWTVATAPVVLTVPARRLPGWELAAAGKNPPLPVGPLQPAAEVEQVQLVPDGATQLRVSVFPLAPGA